MSQTKKTVEVVERVLSREINPQVTATINSLGGKARGFSGADIFTCRKMGVAAPDGTILDAGFVGEVVSVRLETDSGVPSEQYHSRGQPPLRVTRRVPSIIAMPMVGRCPKWRLP